MPHGNQNNYFSEIESRFDLNLYIWVGGWVIPLRNNATLCLHLASWNLLNSQLSLESKIVLSMVLLPSSVPVG